VSFLLLFSAPLFSKEVSAITDILESANAEYIIAPLDGECGSYINTDFEPLFGHNDQIVAIRLHGGDLPDERLFCLDATLSETTSTDGIYAFTNAGLGYSFYMNVAEPDIAIGAATPEIGEVVLENVTSSNVLIEFLESGPTDDETPAEDATAALAFVDCYISNSDIEFCIEDSGIEVSSLSEQLENCLLAALDNNNTREVKIQRVANCVNAIEDDQEELDAENADLLVCESEGGVLAWVLCPIFNFLNEGLSGLFNNFIAPMLQFNALNAETVRFNASTGDESESSVVTLNQDDGSATLIRDSWSRFRNIANILFVIALFVVIFAQSLSINLDAYTVKKMLPRLVVAIILVQLSYFLCVIFSDLMNVLGAGVRGLILSPMDGGRSFSLDLSVSGFWANAGTVVIAVGAVAGVILFFALPILSAALLGLLGVLFTLGLRQVLLVFLVLISPIAMVAWILPNTQRYAQQWFSTFLKLGFMYPLIVGLITVGDFMGGILGAGARTLGSTINPIETFAAIGNEFTHLIANFGQSESTASAIFQLIGLIAVIAPYFMIPFTFKFAGQAMGMAGNFASGLSKRGAGIGGGFAKKKRERYRNETALGVNKTGNNRFARRAAQIGNSKYQRRNIDAAGIAEETKTLSNLSKDELIDTARGVGDHATSTRSIQAAQFAAAQNGWLDEKVLQSAGSLKGLKKDQREAHVNRLKSQAMQTGQYHVAAMEKQQDGTYKVNNNELAKQIHSLRGEQFAAMHQSTANLPETKQLILNDLLSGDDEKVARATTQLGYGLNSPNADVRELAHSVLNSGPNDQADHPINSARERAYGLASTLKTGPSPPAVPQTPPPTPPPSPHPAPPPSEETKAEPSKIFVPNGNSSTLTAEKLTPERVRRLVEEAEKGNKK